MATYSIIEANPIYYLIDVEFAGMTFRQLLASEMVSGDLQGLLQDYADQYESEWMAMQPQVPYPEPPVVVDVVLDDEYFMTQDSAPPVVTEPLDAASEPV